MIPYGRQSISREDIDAVIEVLNSDFLTQGPQVPAFEKTIMSACDVSHAIAVNSATSALHIACLALGLSQRDRLWTSPISFVASANCALYCGAEIDFVDIDPHTFNLSVTKLESRLKQARTEGRLPKIVVPVHMAGQSCEMQALHQLGEEYGFSIIEDASHAIGGTYKNKPVGNCRYSDITVFSFHPVKIVTTAEGGVATTNDPQLAAKLDLLRSHGITRDPDKMLGESDGPWYYQQIELGYNYRMTEMQAALGASQMQRLEKFIARRRELARRYDQLLAKLPLTRPTQHQDTNSSWHLYIIQPWFDQLQKNQEQVFKQLRDNNIGVNLHYIPIHRQPFYQKLGFRAGDFPIAEEYYGKSISIPLFHGISDEQQDEVVTALQQVLI